MKKTITAFSSVAIRIVVFLAILSIPTMVFAWGDNSGNPDGRPEYTEEMINNGVLGDTITFNSISDNPMGHEFNFVGTRENNGVNLGKDNVWNADSINVEDGKTYIVRLYAHNNNPRGRDAVAKNVKVAFNIPGDTANTIRVNGFVSSSNATPTEYWDHVDFTSDQPFHLEYIAGSARLFNNGAANVESADDRGAVISDDLVRNPNGVKIGYDTIDSGCIPGCYQYDEFVSILVKAVFEPEYTIQTSVRPAGTKGKNWTDLLEVNVGDEVEYQIEYENTSNENQYNVMIRDLLPRNLEYVAGSTRLWNEEFTGATIRQDDLVTERAINIGNYAPGANAYVRFNARVIDKDLAEGSNTLVNWGHCTVGETVMQDYAGVVLYKDTKFTNTMIVLTFLVITCLLIISALLGKLREEKRM